jgi:hypothetical protein
MLKRRVCMRLSFSSVTSTRQGPLSASLSCTLVNEAQRGGLRVSRFSVIRLSRRYHLWLMGLFGHRIEFRKTRHPAQFYGKDDGRLAGAYSWMVSHMTALTRVSLSIVPCILRPYRFGEVITTAMQKIQPNFRMGLSWRPQ